jgi:hypothetical protein
MLLMNMTGGTGVCTAPIGEASSSLFYTSGPRLGHASQASALRERVTAQPLFQRREPRRAETRS